MTMRTLPGWMLLLATPVAMAQPPQMPPAAVVVEPVERMEVAPTVPITGTVYSRDDLQITMGVDGRLDYVAEPGTRVRAGDAIARIDTTQLRLSRDEQAAQATRAGAQLRFLDAQLRRQRNLADTNVLAANELEQTESQRDVAASDLRIAEVRLAQIDEQLQRAVVRAAFDGVVTGRMRREGEDVSRGTPVARLLDTSRLEVRVLAPLRYQGRVSVGDELQLYGFEREATGRVRAIVPATDPRNQSFELLIDISGADDLWTVGELVSVALPVRSGTLSLVVPRDALILRQDGSFVYRVTPEGTAERVAVTLGDSAGDRIAVRGNLNEGDRVVVRGGETVAPGQPVNILETAQSAATEAERDPAS